MSGLTLLFNYKTYYEQRTTKRTTKRDDTSG
jgi:hypothetical protein